MKLRGKLAWLVLLLLAVHSIVLCAGFVAPYAPDEQDRLAAYAPPTRVHLFDNAGHFHLRPFVYALVPDEKDIAVYRDDPSTRYPVKFFETGATYTIAGIWRGQVHLFAVATPGRMFLLGTDGYGRDQFSRLLYGGQISLLAGLLATSLSLVLGLVLGALAGYFGGLADDALMRAAELFLALPWLYLLFAVRAFLPLHTDAKAAFLLLIGVIGAVGWARPARLVRGIVLSAKERNYVLAARGFGASHGYILARHVLPETYPVLLTQAALLLPQYVLAEVTLSFLGLGVGEPVPTWGNMMAALQHYHVLASYWWMLTPAFVLIPLFLVFHATADMLQRWLQCAS